MEMAGAFVASASDPVAIAGDEAIEPVPHRQAPWQVQGERQRPEERDPSREQPERSDTRMDQPAPINHDHLAHEIVHGNLGKVAGHPRVVERKKLETARDIKPSEDRYLPTAETALSVVEYDVARWFGGCCERDGHGSRSLAPAYGKPQR